MQRNWIVDLLISNLYKILFCILLAPLTLLFNIQKLPINGLYFDVNILVIVCNIVCPQRFFLRSISSETIQIIIEKN